MDQLSNDLGDLLEHFEEARRLVDEASVRVATGDYMAALSSLAALQPLQRHLVAQCVDLRQPVEDCIPAGGPVPTGLYL